MTARRGPGVAPMVRAAPGRSAGCDQVLQNCSSRCSAPRSHTARLPIPNFFTHNKIASLAQARLVSPALAPPPLRGTNAPRLRTLPCAALAGGRGTSPASRFERPGAPDLFHLPPLESLAARGLPPQGDRHRSLGRGGRVRGNLWLLR